MKAGPTFQDVILQLQHFWVEQGCLLWQPYYSQLGAGTMNPATFLRVLGPEPWRVAYVEPTVRPDDARYGENPNRMQQHYQFQVILKPDPGNPQELYLHSLERIGIDLRLHDVRFVEDNWESPALAAWGLGWEVWLDGMEITQYTYFQQAGGQTLDPVSVELTYGIDRIVMALQGARHFGDVRWNEAVSYAELLLDAEREHSIYYLEAAEVERIQRLYDEYEAEAGAALQRGLLLPAYDYLLKCSHTFNVLDSRGVVGVSERAAYFERMRSLARRIAAEQLARRERGGFPLGVVPRRVPTTILAPVGPPLTEPAPFLFEIGTEELPHADAAWARAAWQAAAPRLLQDHGLSADQVQVLGTPRRIVLLIHGLSPTQATVRVAEKGPPAEKAFDPAGKPTAAAIGWARKQGISAEPAFLRSLIREAEGGRYLFIEQQRGGDSAGKVLRESVLPALLAGLKFERSMRWLPQRQESFARPVRWLTALHADRVVPFEYAGLIASAETRGLRGPSPAIVLHRASDYPGEMQRQGVVLDPQERRAQIVEAAARLAAEVGGRPVRDDDLIDEVVDLVEAPVVLRGQVDEEYLSLPGPVLVAVMRKYQRTFAVERDGSLLPYFLVVANGRRDDSGDVRRGNETVLRSRLADAAYFVRRDLERPLEAYRARLATIVFHSKRGTMRDKTDRLARLVRWLGSRLSLPAEELAVVERAAQLCKADLATRMVVEITGLHGAMGREYARKGGEPAAVADAIFEHVLPRGPADDLPETRPGIALSLADRLDTLAALFSVGAEPTGTRDPYGLRRTGLGLIQVLVGRGLRIDLAEGLSNALEILGVTGGQAHEPLRRTLEFLRARLQAALLSNGRRHDVVEAVLARQGSDPAGAARAVEELETWRNRPDWPETLQAFARCARILGAGSQDGEVDPQRFAEDEERELYDSLRRAEGAQEFDGSPARFLTAFRPMVPAITRFFDEVLVMSDDPALRANRLHLLRRVHRLSQGIADLSKLEGY